MITDIDMPEIDGFEVVRRLRRHEATQHVPIVAITATASPDDWMRLTTLGADGYLAKPFKVSTLVRVVRRMLSRRPS